jgi:peptidoglycan/LPS O-acetylase OafA/YrhL
MGTTANWDDGLAGPYIGAAREAKVGRIEQLDGLRAIAFLLVFLNHSIQLPMAWIGVDLFFVLSGFLITGILLDTRERPFGRYIGQFYRRRVQRILPPYLLVLALVIAFVPPPGWHDIWWQYFTFSQNVATAFESGVGVLNPFWSLAVEEQFYLLWPIVCFVLGRRRLYWAVCGIILAAPVLRAIATPWASLYTIIFTLTPFRADLLAAGALVALLWRDRRALVMKHSTLILACAAVAGGVFFFPAVFMPTWRATANSMLFNTVGYSVDVVLFALVVAVALASQKAWIQWPLRLGWLRFVGRISYMCYLIHEPILHFTLSYGRWAGSAAALALTLAFATLSWFLLERPILSFGADRRLEQPGI